MASVRALRDFVRARLFRLSVSDRWDAETRGTFKRRHYASYGEYIEHQRAKLGRIDLEKYDVAYRRALRERLARAGGITPGAKVVCLAARIGTEVKAFTDLGCFAVGIDLNPGPANQFVLHGDFHELQFADSTADIVFTNSLDHCFDLPRVLSEVRRVLRPGGFFIVEAVRGSEEGCTPLFYESFAWARIDDLVQRIAAGRLECRSRMPFDYPWAGEQLRFEKAIAGA